MDRYEARARIEELNLILSKTNDPELIDYINKRKKELDIPDKFKEYRRKMEQEMRARVKKIIESNESKGLPSLAGFTIEEMDLSVHAYKYLKRAGISTIQELEILLRNDPKEFSRFKDMGKRAMTEILDTADNMFGIDTKLAREICGIYK